MTRNAWGFPVYRPNASLSSIGPMHGRYKPSVGFHRTSSGILGKDGEWKCRGGVRTRWIGQLSFASLDRVKPSNRRAVRNRTFHQPRRVTEFYEVSRRGAEEYGREFIKRYDGELNTTLIFVCVHVPLGLQAGLFSAVHVTSAFIIQVQPAPAGPKRRDGHPPSYPHSRDRQNHFRLQRSYGPALVRSPDYLPTAAWKVTLPTVVSHRGKPGEADHRVYFYLGFHVHLRLIPDFSMDLSCSFLAQAWNRTRQ